jgi:dTDP-4-dehydrorhamnose 3,5-epimerase
VCYKVDGFYDRQSEGGIRFDDPDLAIDWGIDPEEAVLSDKDRVLPLLRELDDVFP